MNAAPEYRAEVTISFPEGEAPVLRVRFDPPVSEETFAEYGYALYVAADQVVPLDLYLAARMAMPDAFRAQDVQTFAPQDSTNPKTFLRDLLKGDGNERSA